MSDTMEYRGYHTKPQYMGRERYFFGKILGINDTVSFHGYSVDEFRAAFEEAVDDYLQLCKEIGKPPEKEYSGQFVLRLPQEVHRGLAISAEMKGISLNSFVTELCESFLATQGR